MGIEIDIDRIKKEMEYSMEEALESWKESVKAGSYIGTAVTTSATSGTHTHHIPVASASGIGTGAAFSYVPATEFISMSMEIDAEWTGTAVEAKPEPVTPAKPIKRYSKKVFKKKLKELCG